VRRKNRMPNFIGFTSEPQVRDLTSGASRDLTARRSEHIQ